MTYLNEKILEDEITRQEWHGGETRLRIKQCIGNTV